MPKTKPKGLRKKTINIDTLSINAAKTAAIYGLAPLGARGWDGGDELEDSSIVITNPNKARKKGTEISR